MNKAIALWRPTAIEVVAHPELYSQSQIGIAWRFLRAWGVK